MTKYRSYIYFCKEREFLLLFLFMFSFYFFHFFTELIKKKILRIIMIMWVRFLRIMFAFGKIDFKYEYIVFL